MLANHVLTLLYELGQSAGCKAAALMDLLHDDVAVDWTSADFSSTWRCCRLPGPVHIKQSFIFYRYV